MIGIVSRRTHVLDDGHRYAIVSSESDIPVRALAKTRSVHIFDTQPSWTNLGAITPWADILERVCVTEGSVTDVSAVNDMPRLKDLTLHVGKLRRDHVDLINAAVLEKFAARWSPPFEKVLASPRLKQVMLEKFSAESLHSLARNAEIVSLDLRNAAEEVSLEPLSSARIRTLKLAAVSLTNFDENTPLPYLEVLELDDVKGVGDLSILKHARVRRLVLEDCGSIPSLGFLADTLEELILVGTTNIIDGDLRSLRHLRVLKGRRRAHYNSWR